MGTVGSQQLQQALPLFGQLLPELSEYQDRRQEHARLFGAEIVQSAVESSPGFKSKSIQFALGERQFRYIELRTQQPQLAVQSSDAVAVDTYIVCVVEHYVLKHRSVAQLYSQPLAEHARLFNVGDAARPQHLALALLSVQAQARRGQRTLV